MILTLSYPEERHVSWEIETCLFLFHQSLPLFVLIHIFTGKIPIKMILYFSATGNSRWVASRLASELGDSMFDLSACLCSGAPLPRLSDVAGIVFPIHSWYVARPLLEALSRLDVSSSAYRYAVCTCGDDAGKAMERLSRHFPFDAAWSVQMPNTYVPMFDLDGDALCRSKLEAASRLLPSIASAVRNRQRVWQVHEGSFAWLKTYVVNPLFVRFVIGVRGFYAMDGCTSCGQCARACPLDNVRVSPGTRPRWGNRCMHCMACLHACPLGVLQYKKSTRRRGRYRLADYL